MMRKQLMITFAACLYYSGLLRIIVARQRRRGRQVIILNYHRATDSDLRSHLLYLRRHYRILHLDEALEGLYTQPSAIPWGGHRRIPLVVTFDDGYQDNYTHAMPLATELQVPLTIFLIPGYLDSGERFWWYEGRHLAYAAQVPQAAVDTGTYCLENAGEREATARVIYDRTCHARSIAEREEFLRTVREALAVPSHDAPTPEEEPKRPLSWEQVQRMCASDWISFGAHTMHHPVLGYLDNPEEIQREVTECREVLQRRLARPIHAFAYPLGRTEHIGVAGLSAVREAGYDWAVTTEHGVNTPSTDPHLLKRISVGQVHWLVLALAVAGVLPIRTSLRQLRSCVTRILPGQVPAAAAQRTRHVQAEG